MFKLSQSMAYSLLVELHSNSRTVDRLRWDREVLCTPGEVNNIVQKAMHSTLSVTFN